MAKAIAFTRTALRYDPAELVRAVLVCGCALALILAGSALPSGL